jgi:rare lipoprotein A (peptidoglycan hydrolase)
MKAKTKKKIKHLLTKKKIIKKKHAKHVGRSVFTGVVLASAMALAYTLLTTHPTVKVNVASAYSNQKISAPVVTVSNYPEPAAPGQPNQSGRGSWYALGLPEPYAITCASRTFPRGSYLQVLDLESGKRVTCLVNDYGPEAWTNRVIDLSIGSFEQVDNPSRGTIPVQIYLVSSSSANKIPASNYAAIIGYSLCNKLYNPNYCDTNRQNKNLLN